MQFPFRGSYGGGTKPWSGCSTFQAPRTDDGMIEVIGLTTYQLVNIDFK